MKGKQMKKKKIIWYAALIVGISILSIMGPKLIHRASGMLLERIGTGDRGETEKTRQTESEGMMASFGIPETEAGTEAEGSPSAGSDASGKKTSGNENSGKDDSGKDGSGKESSGGGTSSGSSSASAKNTAASDQKKKEVYDQQLSKYEESFHPKITESRKGLYEQFIGDREKAFDDALADHLYSVYGHSFEATKVYLTDAVGEDDEELTFQIQVFITYEGDEYHDYYFCRYNKVYDFYSVYAYHE